MKRILLSIASLALFVGSPSGKAASFSVHMGDNGISVHDRSIHDHYDSNGWHRGNYVIRERADDDLRLISTTRETIRESDGDRVVVTRRVFETPTGERVVKVSKTKFD